MLQNSMVTAFAIFESLRENQLGGGGGIQIQILNGLGLCMSYDEIVSPLFSAQCH